MSVQMKALKEYNIQFVGLKLGKHQFEYNITKAFFDCFEYDEFNEVNVKTNLTFDKKTTLMELNFQIEGWVNVNCDLTNEPYNQEVEGSFDLVVKFGQEYNDENDAILIIPHAEYEINVAQYIYELIILSVPLKRIHPGVKDGTLKSEALEKLEELSPKQQDEKNNTDEVDPRWDKLKKLITDK